MENHSISTDRVFALYQSQSQFPVDFDDAWQWLGYFNKSTAKRALLSCGFEEGIDLRINAALSTARNPRPEECITLTVDCFKMWAMMAGTEKGRQTRIYFLECERKLKQVIQAYLPKPKSLLDLSTTQLYQLAAYKLAIEFGKQPDPELIEGIDPAHLEATVDAAQYAYYAKIAGIASGTKVANDIYREIGYMKTSRKEIEQERKDIVEMEQYVKKLEAGELGTKRKADFDRFESEQIALFEATQAARASLEASFEN